MKVSPRKQPSVSSPPAKPILPPSASFTNPDLVERFRRKAPLNPQGYRIWPYGVLGLMVRDAPQAALLTMRV
jgi:hypothetical protein